MRKIILIASSLNIFAGVLILSAVFVYIGLSYFPDIWYQMNPQLLEADIDRIASDPYSETTTAQITKALGQQPQIIKTSRNNHIEIPSIGLDTVIVEGDDEYTSLLKGVWRMPKYGAPPVDGAPTVLAAHRWGISRVTNAYRRQHYFLDLPKVKVSDEIKITWDGNLIRYKVTDVTSANRVEKLSDLVLITCKFYSRPERIIVYAEKVEEKV